MKQVKFRSVLLLLLIVLLGLGLALFCLRYTFRGEAWASFSANSHLYTNGRIATGTITDRNGLLLATSERADIKDYERVRDSLGIALPELAQIKAQYLKRYFQFAEPNTILEIRH